MQTLDPLGYGPVVWTDLKGFCTPSSLSAVERPSSLRPFLVRVFLWVPFAEGSACPLLKQGFIPLLKQGFTHSPVFRSKGFLGKGFTVRGFGFLIYLCWDLCFLPMALLLGGKKALFILWH